MADPGTPIWRRGRGADAFPALSIVLSYLKVQASRTPRPMNDLLTRTTATRNRPQPDAWTFTAAEVASATRGERCLNPSMDLSNACSLNCVYCFVERDDSTKKTRRTSELDVEELIQVVDSFHSLGARTVNLVGAGEPTEDPRLTTIVQRIHDLGMRTMLFTHGARIARDIRLSKWLFERSVTVALKMNSRIDSVQNRLVRSDGYAAKRDQALKILIDSGFSSEFPTRLAFDCIVSKESMTEVIDIYQWCRESNIHPIMAGIIPTGRTADDQPGCGGMTALSSIERFVLNRALTEIDKSHGILARSGCAYFGGDGCTQILGMYVDIQGAIWPCVARRTPEGSTAPLGSVRPAVGVSLLRAWQSDPTLRGLRENYTGRCPYKEVV